MGRNISSNVLFHFVNKYKYLEEIIKNMEMNPRFCKEELYPFFKDSLYIPMKCFCDIPLSLISDHTSFYGEYGIALSKEWGISNGLQPVMYFNPSSVITQCFNDISDLNIENFEIKIGDDGNISSEVLNKASLHSNLKTIYCNHKPLVGYIEKRSGTKSNKLIEKVFYDEREWRYLGYTYDDERKACYVPVIYEVGDYQLKKEKLQKWMTKTNKLKFTVNDINFIILRNDSELIRLSKLIDKSDLTDLEKVLLKTRIIKYSDIDKNV